MSKIFQALAKTNPGASAFDRAPAEAPPSSETPSAPKPSLRMPRVVEWRPPNADPSEPEAEPHQAAPAPEPESLAPPPQPQEEPSRESGLLLRLPKPAPTPAVIRTITVTAAGSKPILPFDLGDSAVNEGYRKIRTQLLQAPTEPRVLVVTSPSQGDGKTLTSINLAGALALKHDITCVLVDADLRRGDIAASCGLPEGPGLGDYLSGRCRLEDALIRVEQLPNLYIITSGEYRINPVELLDSPRWQALLENLRRRFRFVVVDVPPMGSLADYDLVEAASDGVILVVRQDHTNRKAVQTALESIPPIKRLGVILNAAGAPIFARRGGFGQIESNYTILPGQ